MRPRTWRSVSRWNFYYDDGMSFFDQAEKTEKVTTFLIFLESQLSQQMKEFLSP